MSGHIGVSVRNVLPAILVAAAMVGAHTAGAPCLSGRVVSDDGEALPGATVRLRRQDAAGDVTVTSDSTGRFAFQDCTAGWYELLASHPARVSLTYGASEPAGLGTPLVLAPGTFVEGVTVRLPRFGVVAGTIRRPDGQPLGSIAVAAITGAIGSSGIRSFSTVASGVSNAAGQFRLGDVPPGRYLLRAAPPVAPIGSTTGGQGYAVTFYPSASNAGDAAWIDVASGRVIEGNDMLIRVDRFVRVVGTASVNGTPLTDGVATLDSAEPPNTPMGTAPVQQGRFLFPAVPAGSYVLRVSGKDVGGNQLRGVSLAALTPGAPTVVADVLVRPTSTVTGTLELTGTSPAPPVTAFRIVLVPRDERLRVTALGAAVRSDGSFTVPGVESGQYRVQLSATAPPLWKLTSVIVADQETIDSFFEVASGRDLTARLVANDRLGELVGSLSNAAGEPAVDFTIVAFPADRALWTTAFRRAFGVRPANNGEFRIAGMPAGAYRVAVVRSARRNEWMLPEFLENLISGSTTVAVNDGGSVGPLRLVVR